ncbi:MAG TPA: hypothetical protein VE713_13615, partial [Pyrinomonadaceae bacterium]|nr:hypothetical protein [Pyrinomonadaceae bacterium]
EFLSGFDNVKRNGGGWTMRCLAHADAHNSLSVREGDDGRILVHCFAGCSTEQVCAARGIALKDLMPETSGGGGKPRIVKVYDYTDEAGTVLYQNCRFEPKDFRQRKPDGNGGFTWKLNGVPRVPYRLPELLQSELEMVFLVEGEKDADNLSALGLLATSLKNWRPEFNLYLSRFSSVVILQDHDRAGVKQASDVALVISGSARALKVVDLFAGEPLPLQHEGVPLAVYPDCVRRRDVSPPNLVK